MIVDFRKRTKTEHIIILCKDTACTSYEAFYRHNRRKGELDAGVHYFIDCSGTVTVARKDDCVADYKYKDFENSVYILAQSNTHKLNSCQKLVLAPLVAALQDKYPEAIVAERIE